jgi:hypothetical protein
MDKEGPPSKVPGGRLLFYRFLTASLYPLTAADQLKKHINVSLGG